MKGRGGGKGAVAWGDHGRRMSWCKWVWADYLRDPGVRACTWGARGFWMEMLGICDASERQGYLMVGGRPATVQEVARIAGATLVQTKRFMEELERNGVFSRDEAGVIYSRRMVRDIAAHMAAVERGSKGGNPALLASDEGPAREVFAENRSKSPHTGKNLRHNAYTISHNNNGITEKEVNLGVKPDSDSESESDSYRVQTTTVPGRGAVADQAPSAVVVVAAAGADTLGGTGTVIHFRPASPELGPQAGAPAAEPANPPPPTLPLAPGAVPCQRGWRPDVPGVAPPSEDEQLALETWNALPGNTLGGVWTVPRLAKLRDRLLECGGLAGWQRAVSIVAGNDFWQGRTGTRGWRPTLDDILDRDRFRRLLEGAYGAWAVPRAQLTPQVHKTDYLLARHGLGTAAPCREAWDESPIIQGEAV